MKKLNGKCLDAFGDKCAYDYKEFIELPEACQNALIIEFFDLVGIYIHPKRNCMGIVFNHWYYIITGKNGMHLHNFLETKIEVDSRTEATNEAIEKANQIFNEL